MTSHRYEFHKHNNRNNHNTATNNNNDDSNNNNNNSFGVGFLRSGVVFCFSLHVGVKFPGRFSK